MLRRFERLQCSPLLTHRRYTPGFTHHLALIYIALVRLEVLPDRHHEPHTNAAFFFIPLVFLSDVICHHLSSEDPLMIFKCVLHHHSRLSIYRRNTCLNYFESPSKSNAVSSIPCSLILIFFFFVHCCNDHLYILT